jgi:hypothetical protein
MAAKKRDRTPQALYEQLLLFPERAEFLTQRQFDGYRVSLDHWRTLAGVFRNAFEAVYRRQSARVLLVHGGQGHGKSLFANTLEKDFNAAKGGVSKFDENNLWHVLSGGPDGSTEAVSRARGTTSLRRVEARIDWLKKEREFATGNDSDLRIFLFDDVQKDLFNSEWAGLTRGEYTTLQAQNQRAAALKSVGERIVEDCRGDFKKSLFVLFSNDRRYLDDLKAELERSQHGLAQFVELPLPEPGVKEEIVRTNTNLLNPRSYWFCLDQGGPQEKIDAYTTLQGDKGFFDSFQAIDRALAAQSRSGRSGRPANKNLLTLVTLGTPPSDVLAFIVDHELEADDDAVELHVGVWLFRKRWASALEIGDPNASRRASLVESEFSLRWIALDITATSVLCTAPSGDTTADTLVDIIRHAPSIADAGAAKAKVRADVANANASVAALGEDSARGAFAAEFKAKGQSRSQVYESPIAERLGKSLSHSLRVRGALKPDIILAEYEPCAVTRAARADAKAIESAIRRSCHVIELTAFLRDGMQGLDAYLIDKVRAYAELLESV